MNGDDRRRSDRIWLTIPLRVEGVDSSGQIVGYPGRSMSLNRYGGRIKLSQEVDLGRPIHLWSPMGKTVAKFRVVETITTRADGCCECGVECLDQENNFWGIEFPSPEDNAEGAKALLDCGMCHTKALMPLAKPDIERLEMDGVTGKYCTKCSAMTHWWFAEMSSRGNREPEQARSSVEMRARWFTAAAESPQRGHPRVCMRLPLWIRGHYGDSDEAHTENISRFGFSFSSERNYLRGEIVNTAFSIPSLIQRTKLPARIVREQVLKGSPRKMYGATFGSQTSFKPLGA